MANSGESIALKMQSIDVMKFPPFEAPEALRAAILRHGVWIDPEIYRYRPHLVPFTIRDARCRLKASGNKQEAWGAPDPQGYFRDDNTLIKNWVKSFTVRSTNPAYDGRRVRTGFVACHVWRSASNERALHADPLLNSFVPNLVWLPSELARLSDQIGSYTQRLLQSIARQLYEPIEFKGALEQYVLASWRRLPAPLDPPEISHPPMSFFSYDRQALRRAHDSLSRVVDGIGEILAGRTPAKVYSKRYGPGLRALRSETLVELLGFLTPFVAVVPP